MVNGLGMPIAMSLWMKDLGEKTGTKVALLENVRRSCAKVRLSLI